MKDTSQTSSRSRWGEEEEDNHWGSYPDYKDKYYGHKDKYEEKYYDQGDYYDEPCPHNKITKVNTMCDAVISAAYKNVKVSSSLGPNLYQKTNIPNDNNNILRVLEGETGPTCDNLPIGTKGPDCIQDNQDKYDTKQPG